MAQSTAQLPSRDDEDSRDAAFSRCCLFDFPCFKSRQSDDGKRRSWWSKGIEALKKAREWSELVAGPKWKTFIRRFNKTAGRARPGKFQYDPLSYSLNFDESRGQNREFECDLAFPESSFRYAAIPVQDDTTSLCESRAGAGGGTWEAWR